MEKELISFIEENCLGPFSGEESKVVRVGKTVFKTKDAKAVHTKALGVINQEFKFKDTKKLLSFFDNYSEINDVLKNQEYFKLLALENRTDRGVLKELKKPREYWNPDYGIIVVTEEDSTFSLLKDLGCNVKFLVDESDVLDLERYDIVQVLDCPNFKLTLEQLPQSVFLKSSDEAYLERYLRVLSGWKENLEILKTHDLNGKLQENVEFLYSLIGLLDSGKKEKLTREKVEEALEGIKAEVSQKVKEMSISGDSLLEVLNKGVLPEGLDKVVREAISKTGISEEVFVRSVPVSIDEKELENVLRSQDINEFANKAERIRGKAEELKIIPEKIRELEISLLMFDFKEGIKNFMSGKEFPEFSESFVLKSVLNEFLENPEPISFILDEENRCSILTGANSGGKTTLLENVLQIVSYSYLGLPLKGNVKVPWFSEIYYFAKNKGSASKGAFETLLTQMSEINPGQKSLILADEIEAVTEPGVAGKMIGATAKFFIDQGSYMIVATHLGQEIKDILPEKARIDGIEAKGLDENDELIVDHNPVLGRLASSTPELIVEKMAKTEGKEYFVFLNEFLKSI